MSERDTELMHLTAESTSMDSRSLVTQAATDCLTGKLKLARRTQPRPYGERTKRESKRDGQEWGRSLPPRAQHIF